MDEDEDIVEQGKTATLIYTKIEEEVESATVSAAMPT